MVDPLVATLILIVVALLGARVSFSSARVPQGPRLIFRTGTHFLLIGVALGPSGLGLVGPEATQQLFPLLALGLGWIGFHFGLQLDWRSLRQFPGSYHAFALAQSVLTLGIFLAVGSVSLRFFDLDGPIPLLLLAVAASSAAITTPAGIAMVSTNFFVKGKVRDLVFFSGSLDAGVGILALQATYAIFPREPVSAGLLSTPQLWLVSVALGLGLLCGIVFLWLVRARPTGEERVLFILGVCAFSAGAALLWGLSPLFVSVIMGAVVANVGREQQKVFRVLQRWEKPVYVTFLLVAGALLELQTWWVAPLAIAYAILRFGGKWIGGAIAASVVPLPFPVPRRVGLGLVPQGGISVALAVSFVLSYSELRIGALDAEATLFAVVVLGVLLSELTGPFFTIRLLRRAGEISPEVEAALAQGDEAGAKRAALRRTGSEN